MWSFSILHRLILMYCAGIKRVKIPVALYTLSWDCLMYAKLWLHAAHVSSSSIFYLSLCYKQYDTLMHHIRLKSMWNAMLCCATSMDLLTSYRRSSGCLCTGVQIKNCPLNVECILFWVIFCRWFKHSFSFYSVLFFRWLGDWDRLH